MSDVRDLILDRIESMARKTEQAFDYLGDDAQAARALRRELARIAVDIDAVLADTESGARDRSRRRVNALSATFLSEPMRRRALSKPHH